MLIPVVFDETQKVGFATQSTRVKADTTLTPGELGRFINAGQVTNALVSGSPVYFISKETEVPENSDAAEDALVSGDNLLLYTPKAGSFFITDQFDRTNITSATVYHTVLDVTATGTLTSAGNGLHTALGDTINISREVARFVEYLTHSGSGEAPRILVEFVDRVK